MTILATLSYASPGDAPVNRAYLNRFAFRWTGDQTVLAQGNPFYFEEHTFGGYRFYVKFKDRFWNWSSNTYTLDWLVEDLWAEEPITHNPVNAGVVIMGVGMGSTGAYGFSVVPLPGLGDYNFFALEAAPPDYWLQLPP